MTVPGNFLISLMAFFFSPQGEQGVIISNKHVLYDLSHKFPNNLGIQEISKDQKNLKTSQNYSLLSSLTPKIYFKYYQKTPEKQKLNFYRTVLFHIKTRICLKYFVHDCNTAYQGISKEVFSNEAKTVLVLPLEKESTRQKLF